jgi:hypothetical protein
LWFLRKWLLCVSSSPSVVYHLNDGFRPKAADPVFLIRQYVAGFMEDESWDAFRQQLQDDLSRESTAAYYQDYGFKLRTSFEDLCDEILKEIKAGG